jgi:hypothetical protein
VKYHVQQAHDFYRKFIYNEELQTLLQKHHKHVAGSVPSIYWELFGAILTGDKGKEGYGSDLEHHEIKSSVQGASFEYQYHLHGGRQKLLDDTKVDHVFVSYSPDYKDIDVRLVKGSVLKERFDSWMPGLVTNYEGEARRQRYRKNIPYGLVVRSGELMMQVRQGELVAVGR